MRSPKDMGIIEIDITNACVHQCANCTRFCGHHEKTFFMSFDKFKEAVDSLEGFEGMIGVIGGEPTLHPEFERFADYIREKRTHEKLNISWGPIDDMQFHITSTVDKGMTPQSRAVLLSTLSPSYYKHFEAINETFGYQLLNDHSSESLHQALLMSRKELSIPDEEWIKKRDACWIQNTWSATITPKGAFFCEVAGSLDMLFGGEGGWPVEPGWWKREPADFADQLHWCELCSGCLDVPKRLSHDERDDVTPGMYDRLKMLNSPKVNNNRVIVRKPEEYEQYRDPTFENGSEYIEAGEYIRMSSDNKSLYPKDIRFLTKETWKNEIRDNKPKDWIILFPDNDLNVEEKEFIRKYFESRIWNPGCLYIIDDDIVAFNVIGRSIRDVMSFPSCIKDLRSYYSKDKIIHLSTQDELVAVIGGDSETVLLRGNRENKRLVIYGAGNVGRTTIKYLNEKGITDFDVAVTRIEDTSDVMGYKLHEIDEYKDKVDDVLVIIAVGKWLFDEVVSKLKEIGITNYRYLA